MMPDLTRQNPYQGINAHLHSALLAEGTWSDFHASHLIDVGRVLKEQLFPMGCTVLAEQSLQIRRYGAPDHFPKADIVVFDTDPVRPRFESTPHPGTAAELVQPVAELLNLSAEEERHYKALAVYVRGPDKQRRGKPVLWLELLSPFNKIPGADRESYQEKRLRLLEAGIVFVEVDYVHRYPPMLAGLSTDYAYRISVIDPRPRLWEGRGRTRQLHVDDPLPTMTLPLNMDDQIEFDFNGPYHYTFSAGLYGAGLDYRQPPEDLPTYSLVDQERIRQKLAALAQTGP